MSYFRNAIASLLSRYVKDTGQDLNVSLWNGELNVQDLVFKTEELRAVLPFNLASATLGSLRVVVPWTRLLYRSTLVMGTQLYLEVRAGVPEPLPHADAEPDNVEAAAPDEEALAIVRSVKEKLKIEVTDVHIALVTQDGRKVHLLAAKLFTGPFSHDDAAADPMAEAGDYEPAEAAPPDSVARRVRLTGVSVRVEERTVVYPASMEVVLSFEAGHLSYCNVLFSDAVALHASDVDLDVLRTLVSSFTITIRPPAPSPPPANLRRPSQPPPVLQPAASPSSESWTAAVWNYGRSWISRTAAAPVASAAAGPVKRLSPPRVLKRRDAGEEEEEEDGEEEQVEEKEPAPVVEEEEEPVPAPVVEEEEAEVLPSWFRMEVPEISVTLVRHVAVAFPSGRVSVAPRPLARLTVSRLTVEWSQSSAALELAARVGSITATDLWVGQPLLACGQADADAVAVDLVRRPYERYVQVTVEPLELSPSPGLVRELRLLLAPFLAAPAQKGGGGGGDDDADGSIEDDAAEEEPLPLLMDVTVTLIRPIVRLKEFEVRLDQFSYAEGVYSLQGLSVARVCGDKEFLVVRPVNRLALQVSAQTAIQVEGPVQLNVCAADLRLLLVVVTDFAEEIGDELPDYLEHDDDDIPDGEEDADTVADHLVRWKALVPERHKSSAPPSDDERGGHVSVSIARLCLQLQDEHHEPLADLLVDSLQLSSHRQIEGSMRGLVLVDRGVSQAGQILLSTSASDSLSSKAYVQLAQQSFAADVVFSSPMYRESDSAKISFSYSSAKLDHDSVPRVAYSLHVSRIRVRYDLEAFVKLGQALKLGVTGLTREQEVLLSSYSTSRLKWHYFSQRLLREQQRTLQHRMACEETIARLYPSWKELVRVQRPRRRSAVISWRLLCLYLQAQASHAVVLVENVSVGLPLSLGLSVASISLEGSHQTTGFAFDRVVSQAALTRLRLYAGAAGGVARNLFFESTESAASSDHDNDRELLLSIPEVSVDTEARLNGVSRISAQLPSLNLALTQLPRLRELWSALSVHHGQSPVPKRPYAEVVVANPRAAMSTLTVRLKTAQVSLHSFSLNMENVVCSRSEEGDVRVALGSSTVVDGSVLLATFSALVAEQSPRQQVQRLASVGLSVLMHREPLERLVALVKDLMAGMGEPGSPRENENVHPRKVMVALRDTCLSLPLGRQSALHLVVGGVKGNLFGETRCKSIALYFGSIRNRTTVVGGGIRIDKLTTAVDAKMRLSLAVGKVAANLELESDAENVQYLIRHYPVPDHVREKDPAPSKSMLIHEVRVASLRLSVGSLLVLGDTVQWGSGGTLAVRSLSVRLRNDFHSLIRVENVHGDAATSFSVGQIVGELAVDQLAAVLETVARIQKLDLARPVPADRGAGFEPPQLRCSVPCVSLSLFGDNRTAGRLLGIEVTQVAFTDGTVRIGALRGTAADTWAKGQPAREFLHVDAASVDMRGGIISVVCEKTITLNLAEPVVRCVSAFHSGSCQVLYPGRLMNELGHLLVLADGRECPPGQVIGAGKGAGLLQVVCGGRRWRSALLDIWSIQASRSIELETSDGDVVDVVVVKVTEGLYSVRGNVLVVNASSLQLEMLHFRAFRTVAYVLNEAVQLASNSRVITFSSDKGKEEDEDEVFTNGTVQKSAVAAAPQPPQDEQSVYCLATARSKFRFRQVGGRRWSEAAVTMESSGERVLVQCSGSLWVWCCMLGSGVQRTLRISAVGLVENRLPCQLYWAATDGSGGCLEADARGPYLGPPDGMNLGLSVQSQDAARTLLGLVDASQSQAHAELERGMQVSIVCFAEAFTRTRHVQVSCPAVLCNETSSPLMFDGQVIVGPHARTAWPRAARTVGVGAQLPPGDEADVSTTMVSWSDGDEDAPLQHVLVSLRRDRVTRCWMVEARPVYVVHNLASFAVSVIARQGSLRESCLVGPREKASLARWALEGATQLAVRLEEDGSCSEQFALQFGTVQLVNLSACEAVVVRVHFADNRSEETAIFPQPIVVTIMEVDPPPVVVRNLTPWPMSVEEQWAESCVSAVSQASVKLFPQYWRDYLLQQRETMEEAIDRLAGGKGSDKPAKARESSQQQQQQQQQRWEQMDPFPYWVRSRPFIFRVRLEAGGNWSELIEGSRPRFFSLLLYSERGSVSVQLSVANRGRSKVITLGGVPAAIPRALPAAVQLRLALIVVQAEGLARLQVAGIVGRRGFGSWQVEVEDVRLDNLVPGAAYPVMLFRSEPPARQHRRPAFVVRTRWQPHDQSHLSKLSVAAADFHLELDYGSVSTMVSGIGKLFNGHHAPSPAAAPAAPGAEEASFHVDEMDLAPFDLVLSWKNPKILIPLDVVSDNMLSIRHLRLRMPALTHSGCALASSDVKELLGQYLKEAFLGQTVRILGSLDVLGNPTGIITAFGSLGRFLQQTWVAAVEGDGQAVLEGTTDAVRTFGGALMTPLVSLSNASARMIGEDGALGTLLDMNRQTINFVYSYLNDSAGSDGDDSSL